MLEWKDCEHEENNSMALGNQDKVDALRNSGLLKFFLCPNMRARPLLLEWLVSMWDLDSRHFMVRDEILTLDINGIYLLKVFPHRGALVVLIGSKEV